MFDIKEQLALLPDKPGVYLMKDKEETIIYVGKAISLKNRVRQYFQSLKNQTTKVQAMVSHIVSFEYIVTDSELEALILECNLIKKNRPKYNVLLRDDKSYPYIKITVNEEFPRVFKTRQFVKDKAKYFGPYTNGGALKETLEVIHKLFPIRTCRRNIRQSIEKKERPCLYYHIKKCVGPCTGNVDVQSYRQMIDEIILFLSGKQDELIRKIESKMKEAAKEMDFENAAVYRDQFMALQNIVEKQKVLSTEQIDQDVIGIYKGEDTERSCAQVFFIRQGKLLQREHFMLETSKESTGEIISSFLKQFYSEVAFIPKEILIQEKVEDQNILEEWLTQKRGNRVKLKAPQKGEKKSLVEMATKNAQVTMVQVEEANKKEKDQRDTVLRQLQHVLELDAPPMRIEAFDISNIQGVESVGSMVVFEEGKAARKHYRRFKIKTVQGANDYASMEEVINRRFTRGLKETKDIIDKTMTINEGKFAIFPDVIMIDGGAGQVSSAQKVLDQLNIDIPICGMVKDDKHRTRGLIYKGEEFVLDKASPLLRFIAKMQDEAHRFAINYHRSLRKDKTLNSILEEIPGIGEKRRQALMKHFKSLDKMKIASVEELTEVEGITSVNAKSIYEFFNK
ncbi:excinuclease ABC subunit UvrC [Serpentinicella sp. ANB-PHB4]|uniref:excinuclease ABC subunit UvrC n=1 Tax=Serpentinicella sp. ANB-PHB4 TaxID=3074076 RepID=UPI00285B8271|nr:excinuclease ABC subunit UvrC [Serpentinicella sp. ANB-PHB4]MDR5659369.1 excinuclease ABC subunit UvrC [Serpentinicella sp. ANB-PHB4]